LRIECTVTVILEEYHHPPPEIVALPSGDIDELIRLLEKLHSSALGPNYGSGVIATEAVAT
jgi:hypothetical protein